MRWWKSSARLMLCGYAVKNWEKGFLANTSHARAAAEYHHLILFNVKMTMMFDATYFRHLSLHIEHAAVPHGSRRII